MNRQIILDTETTGLSPKQGHRIIEVGCVEMINRRLTGNHFHFYINPKRRVDPGAMAIHGITDDFLQDKPLFEEVAEALVEFIKGAELIIHNAPFDVGFLDYELGLFKKRHPKIKRICTILDTLELARQKHPGQKNSLDALCKRYEVDNTKRELHGALLDAEILANVYLAMTAGQDDLLGGEPSSIRVMQKTQGNYQDIVIKKKGPFKIIHANEEELKAHTTFFE